MTLRKRYAIVSGIAIAALVVAATGEALIGNQSPPSQPMAYAPIGNGEAGAPAAVGLQVALGDMGKTDVASVAIDHPPVGVIPPSSAPWMYATVLASSTANGLDIAPLWQADLIEGVVADRATSSNDVIDGISGATFKAQLPDGSLVDVGSGIGDVAHGQQFSHASSHSVALAVADALRAEGLTPVSVKVFRPDGPAPEVIASTTDVTSTATNLVSIIRSVFGNPPTYEGYYLEIRDAQGTAWVRASASFRSGAGRFWIDPRYASLCGEQSLGQAPQVAGAAPVSG